MESQQNPKVSTIAATKSSSTEGLQSLSSKTRSNVNHRDVEVVTRAEQSNSSTTQYKREFVPPISSRSSDETESNIFTELVMSIVGCKSYSSNLEIKLISLKASSGRDETRADIDTSLSKSSSISDPSMTSEKLASLTQLKTMIDNEDDLILKSLIEIIKDAAQQGNNNPPSKAKFSESQANEERNDVSNISNLEEMEKHIATTAESSPTEVSQSFSSQKRQSVSDRVVKAVTHSEENESSAELISLNNLRRSNRDTLNEISEFTDNPPSQTTFSKSQGTESHNDKIPFLNGMKKCLLPRPNECQICQKCERENERLITYCENTKSLVHHACLIKHVRYCKRQNARPCSICDTDYITIQKLIPLHQRIIISFEQIFSRCTVLRLKPNLNLRICYPYFQLTLIILIFITVFLFLTSFMSMSKIPESDVKRIVQPTNKIDIM